MKLFPLDAIDNGAGTIYVPFIGGNQQVGYACQRVGKPTQYVFLNPSYLEDPYKETPAVFLYTGFSGDPAIDTPEHNYTVPA